MERGGNPREIAKRVRRRSRISSLKRGATGQLMDVRERAADILGRRADIMTRGSLHPRLRKRIEQSVVLVF
jgi:predicted nucleotidyltransferase